MNVKLRQRQKGGKISLYLDFYHKGKRSYEYLELYLIPENPGSKLSRELRDSNKQTLMLAESIRAKRQIEIQNGHYGFRDQEKMKASFVTYMELLAENRRASQGNYDNWKSALKYVKSFAKADVTFAQVDNTWLEGFKVYLQDSARTNLGRGLSQNSQTSYFNKVRAAVKQAVREGIILRNPSEQVRGIKAQDTERVFLTYEELQKLASTPCEMPVLKAAFVFSCMTGLRWSDIEKLTWSEVQHSTEMGYYIRFRQKKTKGVETLPISESAASLLGAPKTPDTRVFRGLQYNAWNNHKLQEWVTAAGINKKITFHCARHTYATLQLTLGTDIYTVSKMLGHRDLKTTQIYARIIDEKKKDAANKIKLEL